MEKYLVTVLARIDLVLVFDVYVYVKFMAVDKFLSTLFAIMAVVFMERTHMVLEAVGILEDLGASGAGMGAFVVYAFDVPLEVAAPRE